MVTEFRTNAVGARLIDRLERAGYDTSHPAVGPKVNTVLIAARIGIERSWAFSESLDPRHLWCAEIDGAYVCGVYMPQNTAKLPFWETLIRDATTNVIDLLIGDFNTGTNDLDKDPRGAKFIGPEMPGRLIASVHRYVAIAASRCPRVLLVQPARGQRLPARLCLRRAGSRAAYPVLRVRPRPVLGGRDRPLGPRASSERLKNDQNQNPQLLRIPHIMRYGGTCPAGTNASAQTSRTPRPLHPQTKRYNTFGRS
ncbi:hypothetical protein [Mycobacterium sp. Root265]|uniref:hypothetical protein n=1 Tax=Mycobacterium sp. Root265 TaxID=1736504 RepID=UPI000A488F21|nr:hypothetical protein [Mycobacterium sp. Root265]